MRMHALVVLSLLAVGLMGCSKDQDSGTVAPESTQDIARPGGTPELDSVQKPLSPEDQPLVLKPHERLITLLGTNDIHGGAEASVMKDGRAVGGLSFLGGIVRATREGLKKNYLPGQAQALLLDGGDQFQGTLVSNFDEGKVVFKAMAEMGYDAVVPGNHDYDFGPEGWLQDQVVQGVGDQDPRGVFLGLIKNAPFAVLSASTYMKDSFVDIEGRPAAVDIVGCKPVAQSDQAAPILDWSRARRAPFLKPYVIKTLDSGVRVALVGIDHPETSQMTTLSNVTDLCFSDEASSYLRVYEEIKGEADLFVMVIHNGAQDGSLVRAINGPAGSPKKVHAVISGHTHQVNRAIVDGVPIIQSASSAKAFGRIDLVWDTQTQSLNSTKTRAFAGVMAFHESCDAATAKSLCSITPQQTVMYEGIEVTRLASVDAEIALLRQQLDPIARRKLGASKAELAPERIKESAIANAFTDILRELSGAEISFMNSGGIRTSVLKGDFYYEDLFRILPFNNHAVMIAPMGRDRLLGLLTRSAKTCGNYGALNQSGLRVKFERDCKNAGKEQLDPNARLLRVETIDGELIYDVGQDPTTVSTAQLARTFVVATLDFLSSGGSGYVEFAGIPWMPGGDLGIAREVFAEHWLKAPAQFPEKTDGRMEWVSKP